MNKLFLLLLLTFISCNPDSSTTPEAGDTNPDVNSTAPVTTTPPPTAPTVPTEPTDVGTITDAWTEEFMELVNNHRRSIGLRSLIHDDEVGLIAIKHSQNMASGTVAFGHTGFSVRCAEARDALGGGNLCAENVAAGQTSPQSAFNSWMNSSGHRANIEQSRVTHTGFGYAKSSSGKYYWTQIFIEL